MTREPLAPTGTLAVAPEDVERVRAACGGLALRAAIVLGSGLGGLVASIVDPAFIPLVELPGSPRPAAGPVAGHRGCIAIGSLAGVDALVFDGRLHLYQGLLACDAAYPVRLAAALGIGTLLVTNAAGGVSPTIGAGSLVALSDHINLTGDNPLTGWSGPPGGDPFVPMGDAYDPQLRAIAQCAAEELGIELPSGVYCGVRGPSYETPAEVAMLRTLGADIVGMSTVPEVIAARALRMRVLGISLVTNQAGVHDLDHAAVLETGRRAAARLESLLLAILQRLQ